MQLLPGPRPSPAGRGRCLQVVVCAKALPQTIKDDMSTQVVRKNFIAETQKNWSFEDFYVSKVQNSEQAFPELFTIFILSPMSVGLPL